MQRDISLFLLLSCREQALHQVRLLPGQGIPPNNAAQDIQDSKTAPFPKPKLGFLTVAELLPLQGVTILEFYSFTVSLKLNAGI